MKTLRIIGVPEHFNYPINLLVESQPFLAQGIRLQWTDESRGSGQMNLALRNDETDLAIILTESFLKDFESGNPSKMIGFHVVSPLIWGAHVRGDSPIRSLNEIPTPHFLISRNGSGSHLMSFELAERENWPKEELSFEIVSNMDGAKAAMESGNDGIFLWEKYTTSPMVKSGHMKRIGEVASPWPCFVMVASEKAILKFGDVLVQFRDLVYEVSKKLREDQYTVQLISEIFHLELQDVKDWLNQTEWAVQPIYPAKEMEKSMERMIVLGILKEKLSPKNFLITGDFQFID
jgi:ABC-type nitrate/sulfonate/bicarbonate transport system substrate-binding protein